MMLTVTILSDFLSVTLFGVEKNLLKGVDGLAQQCPFLAKVSFYDKMTQIQLTTTSESVGGGGGRVCNLPLCGSLPACQGDERYLTR